MSQIFISYARSTAPQAEAVAGALRTLGYGVWRDDERGGMLVKDEPVVIHCYTTPADIADPDRLGRLGSFCRRMGREAHQGEIGLVIGDEYLAFRDFSKE